MSKFPKIILIFGIFVLIIGAIFISIKKQEKPVDFEYSMKTGDYDKATGKVTHQDSVDPSKYLGMLQFNAKPDSKNMATALVCAEQVAKIEKVDLYMPDMGHGSQPPTVAKGNIPSNLQSQAGSGIGFGCLNISNMQLFMPGLWQVRLFYSDGKVGLFNVEIGD
ncbi:hypothetical protein [Silvanigrella aquatica]|uniref:Uncharacterized protein n=1 Tax=Silvanigrella aquatica TaxID=1915309 RepID=A0A1L4D004_9BACT|nr:hypothetical protein [Silvanigrella aquatica]APJ03529.1 hypothetical protein AXG55_06250 [Silvanigrella aquatica]